MNKIDGTSWKPKLTKPKPFRITANDPNYEFTKRQEEKVLTDKFSPPRKLDKKKYLNPSVLL